MFSDRSCDPAYDYHSSYTIVLNSFSQIVFPPSLDHTIFLWPFRNFFYLYIFVPANFCMKTFLSENFFHGYFYKVQQLPRQCTPLGLLIYLHKMMPYYFCAPFVRILMSHRLGKSYLFIFSNTHLVILSWNSSNRPNVIYNPLICI